MTIYWTAIAAWLLLMALFAPYVQKIRHPAQKSLAAYLIFVTIFTAASFIMFILLTYLVTAADWVAALERPMPILLFLIGVFLPAFLVARWQARKPPRPSPRI